MKAPRFEYERPLTSNDAIRILSDHENSKIIAGGQSLGPMLNFRVADPGLLVDISQIEEMRQISSVDDWIVIGASVRHSEFEDGAVPSPIGAMFSEVANGIAYRAVRNRGTVGGSLAHADPAADWPSVMTALGARLDIRNPTGKRTIEVSGLSVGPLENCLDRNELIEAVRVPTFSQAARWGRYKINVKPGDFAEAAATVVLDPERAFARVVVSGARQSPVEFAEISKAILGTRISAESGLEEKLEAELSRLDLSSYERRLYRACVVRAVRKVSEQ